MGLSFSTIQIKNSRKLSRAQFQEEFRDFMKKKGFIQVPNVSDKNAVSSYKLVFSDKSGWVTLCSDDGDVSARKDAPELAEFFRTHCVVTSVWDSDMLELHLFGENGGEPDKICAGRMPWGDSPDAPPVPRGKRELWEPLIAEGFTWERFSEKIENAENETFVESALYESAPFLGMDSFNVIRSYRQLENKPDEAGVITLRFESTRKIPLFLKDGPTVLRWQSASSPTEEKDGSISFYNIGGVSKGVCVFWLGECFENGVEISKLRIRRLKDPKKFGSAASSEDYEIFTAIPEKKEYENGLFGYFAVAPDYEFSEGINTEHPSLAGNKMYGKKCQDLIWGYSTSVHYTVKIKSGLKHKLRVGAAPLANWTDGQTSVEVTAYKDYKSGGNA